jgi:PleD family two-component response regulator
MSNYSFPFAVRLIGFSNQEADAFDASFAVEQGKGYGYFSLSEDNLKDPDIFIANADDLKALVTLSDLRPSVVRPALLVGLPSIALPYSRVERPIRWNKLYEILDDLVEKRADALSKLDASAVVSVSERRRRDRMDVDLTDPSEYPHMRTRLPDDIGILIVDKSPRIQSYLAEWLMRHNMPVAWVNDETKAADLCSEKSIAVVLINTSTPGVDPYRLCKTIKQESRIEKTAVIFLIGKPFVYDPVQARDAGADGYLTKPLVSNHLLSTLKKFLPPLWR